MKKLEQNFAPVLLQWNRKVNTRQMPWKGEKDAYLIWLSEIILQQTRVEQGLPYFLKFKSQYPTVKHLALAPADEVMRLWQGLGYYSRARNLHQTAQTVYTNHKGHFPSTFEGLMQLKGVGDYTAAAIASFAFGEPRAVVDGNVIRVLARVFGIETPFDTTQGKKQFASLAQQLIDVKQPGPYNQAIMDFGAVVCTPANPQCKTCPFNKSCVAFKTNRVDVLPVRLKKTAVKNRYFNFLLVTDGKHLLIEQRTGNDIWKELYQLPMAETDTSLKKNFKPVVTEILDNAGFEIVSYSKEFIQLLTHRKVHARFIKVQLKDFKGFKHKTYLKVTLADLNNYGFPKVVQQYLAAEGYLK